MKNKQLIMEYARFQKLAGIIHEDLDWRDDYIYDTLCNMDLERLVSDMLGTVEENPSITLFEYLKKYEKDEED